MRTLKYDIDDETRIYDPLNGAGGLINEQRIFGVIYHKNDFVFLRSEDGDISRIGQIRAFLPDGKKVNIMFYTRGPPDALFGDVGMQILGATSI